MISPVGKILPDDSVLCKFTYRTYYFQHRLKITAVLNVRKWRSNLRHDASIDPFQIFWIDPDEISTKVWGGDGFGKESAGLIIGGDWDEDVQPISDYKLYHMFRTRFIDGAEWNETDFYQELIDRVESGERIWHGCKSIEDVDERCRRLDALYQSIREYGVLEPEKVSSRAYRDPIVKQSAKKYPINLRSISVNIDRDGNPVLDDGRHRTLIAQLCDIERIPVSVIVRHKQWQQQRDRAARENRELDHFDYSSSDPIWP